MSGNNGNNPTQIDEDLIEVNEGYGFKANLRQKVWHIVRRNEFLEKMNIPYAVTIRGILVLMVALGLLIIIVGQIITDDWSRAKYIGVGVFGLGGSVFGIVILSCLVMPSYGSVFKSGISFIRQLIKRMLVLLGWKKPPRETGIDHVRSDGTIMYSNGDFGRMYKVDGRTSATSYPSEILEQESITAKYHSNRLVSTSEFHITSSQRQNTETQMANLEMLANATKDKAKYDLINLEYTNLSNYVNGVKQTFEHHVILRDANYDKLQESMEIFEDYAYNKGMYYEIVKYGKKDTKAFLSDFYELK